MQEQAGFEQRGAPTSAARPGPSAQTAASGLAQKGGAPEDEGALRPLHWAILAALALLGLAGSGVIILASARQPAPPAAQADR